ncbi:MAG: hypothetical protein LBV40_03815 [Methanomicrobiales archaeon]|jgi:hypothetical protein|nr:hypothetical protein [Methanomicrobiales archaeon]
MDSFFDRDRQLDVLLEQYEKHGKIIVAFDFDDTVHPFRGNDCRQVIQLLRDLRPYAHLICFTARFDEKLEVVREFLVSNNIPYDYINKEFNGDDIAVKKVLYNQLLDDKAGLYESYLILTEFIKHIGENKAKTSSL